VTLAVGAPGGFGGGGGGAPRLGGGGGGGGYNGGGAGSGIASSSAGRGADGSDFLAGSITNAAYAATNTGDGYFTFEAIGAPEPSTWALGLGGLALVGAAVRRRRARLNGEASRLGFFGYLLRRRLAPRG
jgi:hypothetical protein